VNGEIVHVRAEFLKTYEAQAARLKEKSRRELEDLLHEAEELLHADDFSVRVAAEVNRAACLVLLGRL